GYQAQPARVRRGQRVRRGPDAGHVRPALLLQPPHPRLAALPDRDREGLPAAGGRPGPLALPDRRADAGLLLPGDSRTAADDALGVAAAVLLSALGRGAAPADGEELLDHPLLPEFCRCDA